MIVRVPAGDRVHLSLHRPMGPRTSRLEGRSRPRHRHGARRPTRLRLPAACSSRTSSRSPGSCPRTRRHCATPRTRSTGAERSGDDVALDLARVPLEVTSWCSRRPRVRSRARVARRGPRGRPARPVQPLDAGFHRRRSPRLQGGGGRSRRRYRLARRRHRPSVPELGESIWPTRHRRVGRMRSFVVAPTATSMSHKPPSTVAESPMPSADTPGMNLHDLRMRARGSRGREATSRPTGSWRTIPRRWRLHLASTGTSLPREAMT